MGWLSRRASLRQQVKHLTGVVEELLGERARPLSESLSEYIVKPHHSACRPEEVELGSQLGHIKFRYPFFTARMQSVVGPEMAVAAGRQGILTCIPRSLPMGDKHAIIDANEAARHREGDIEYVQYPSFVQPLDTLSKVQRRVVESGYSVLPVLSWFTETRGFYIHDPEHPIEAPPNTPIRQLLTPLRSTERPDGIPFLNVGDPSNVGEVRDDEVHRIMDEHGTNFVPIVDNVGHRLQLLAFRQKRDTNYIGVAVNTSGTWKEQMHELGERVDTMMLDSSNAWYAEALQAIRYAKKHFSAPFGAGNVVTRDQFNALAEAGADYVIVGMAVGSICQTGSQRGNGRGQATAMAEVAGARDEYEARTGRRVPIVLDGGIRNVKDIIVALSHADYAMMGGWFNKFKEAAGQNLDAQKRPLEDNEAPIAYKETWGEGSLKAQRIAREGMGYSDVAPEEVRGNARYGTTTNAAVTIEGVEDCVSYGGLLKPGVEEAAHYIRATMSSAGGSNLEEYRRSVKEHGLLERCSARTVNDIHPHSLAGR